METQRIYLYENDESVYLDSYVCSEGSDLKRKAILILPGGGYGGVAIGHEGDAVAKAFIAEGFSAFVLKYSTARTRAYPAQLIEVSLAIKHIKDNAQEYSVDKSRLFVLGFSAGGHLCASIGTMWHRKEVYDAIPDMPYGYNKPAGIMPIYPVVSGIEFSHKDSFRNLLAKDNPADEELKQVSAELAVDQKSAPAFIAHSAADKSVPCENSLMLALAYSKNKIPFELHIFPKGAHGISLGTEATSNSPESIEPSFARWFKQALFWADNL